MNLENLRKSAKRWLKALRAGDHEARQRLRRAYPGAPDEPSLRDIQHALARERGLDNWTSLQEAAVRSVTASAGAAWPYWRITDPREFDEVAHDMVRVHDTGDNDAVRRLSKRYGIAVTPDALRTEVRRRLNDLLQTEAPDGPFGLAHARIILARDAGYESWGALLAELATNGSEGRTPSHPIADDAAPDSLSDPIQPVELKTRFPMEMQGGEYSTTTDVWKMLVASRAGDIGAVRALVAQTPGLATCCYNYMSPLHLAVRGGHAELTTYLLERGALDFEDVTYPYGETLLTIADDRGFAEIAKRLKAFAGRPNAGRPSVKTSHGPGYIQITRDAEQERLRLLIEADNRDAVEALVGEHPRLLRDDLANDGEGILSGVAHRPNKPMLELLMQHGASVPKVTKWARAYYFKHYFIAALLLDRGMDPNHMTWHRTTLLHEIAWEGDVRKATLLLDHGADLNAVDEEFRSTPLGMAARWGRRNMIKLFLDRGADPSRSGAAWAAPLAWAERKGHRAAIRDLRAAGAR